MAMSRFTGSLCRNTGRSVRTSLGGALRTAALAVVAAAMCVLGDARAEGDASVTTDATDYAPGTTAYVTGAGFEAGETVTCEVAHTDGTGDHDPWDVTADDGGAF